MTDDDAPDTGKRLDGKPYKDGNTREDGSYETGKGRPPSEHKFRKGDGRKRGKREKGSKNLSYRWAKALAERLTINGKTQDALSWTIEMQIRRAIAKSDRAAERVLENAARLEVTNEKRLTRSDDEILADWLAERFGNEPRISDDHGIPTGTNTTPPAENGDGGQ